MKKFARGESFGVRLRLAVISDLTFGYHIDNMYEGNRSLEIINATELTIFGRKHPNARRALSNWIDMTSAATWKNFSELRETFRSADYMKNVVIFDIGGNNYRLVVSVDYHAQRLYILEIMTHAEYNRWQP